MLIEISSLFNVLFFISSHTSYFYLKYHPSFFKYTSQFSCRPWFYFLQLRFSLCLLHLSMFVTAFIHCFVIILSGFLLCNSNHVILISKIFYFVMLVLSPPLLTQPFKFAVWYLLSIFKVGPILYECSSYWSCWCHVDLHFCPYSLVQLVQVSLQASHLTYLHLHSWEHLLYFGSLLSRILFLNQQNTYIYLNISVYFSSIITNKQIA